MSIENPLDINNTRFVCAFYYFKSQSLVKKNKLQAFKKYLTENFCIVKAFMDSKKKATSVQFI